MFLPRPREEGRDTGDVHLILRLAQGHLFVKQLRPADVAQQDVHHDWRAEQPAREPVVRDGKEAVREEDHAVAEVVGMARVLKEAGRQYLRRTTCRMSAGCQPDVSRMLAGC
jgi:hypothetical protein